MNDEKPVENTDQVQEVQPEQPVQEVQETSEDNQVTETSEPEVTEPSQTNEGADAPEPSDEEPDSDPDFDPVSAYGQYNHGQPQLQASEDGTVDPYQLMNVIEQRMEEKLRFQRQEERAWKAVERKYPEVKSDKQMRQILLNQRIAGAVQGQETNLVKIADQLYGRNKEAKSQGRAEANISKKVQRAASLESATSNTGATNTKAEERLERIASGDKYAAQDLLGEWLSEGKI
jgi:hypothetical protein